MPTLPKACFLAVSSPAGQLERVQGSPHHEVPSGSPSTDTQACPPRAPTRPRLLTSEAPTRSPRQCCPAGLRFLVAGFLQPER